MKAMLKKCSAIAFAVLFGASLVACNTDIKVDYGYNPASYVTLGQYKEIPADIDQTGIVNAVIEERVKADLKDYITYSEVDRAAQNEDRVKVTFRGSVGGSVNEGFSADDYEFIIGTDQFPIDGFADALIGMKKGDFKSVILKVPDNYQAAPEYSGERIVFDITMDAVGQPIVPMVTDAFVKENLGYDSVDAYHTAIKEKYDSQIQERITKAKKEAVLKQLSENNKVNGYPQSLYDQRSSDLSTSILFYSTLYDEDNETYCQRVFGMSFDDYVLNSVNQELIMEAIAVKEGLKVTEYEYKGDLDDFASQVGFGSKDDMLKKYDKDYIVKQMVNNKAQQLVLDSAVYNIK